MAHTGTWTFALHMGETEEKVVNVMNDVPFDVRAWTARYNCGQERSGKSPLLSHYGTIWMITLSSSTTPTEFATR
ncbi:hypothetical protein M378DRAFT_159926 [Amanita muscaria Koide BX008]|uniref:Uncharacterized protein n=1 Tax=Amanita muscaria (strain Koide BX008) TaxID=946122 RepID=A0A0C2XDR1_AMAMK|nr:hypothetical protein M378DRAFT_159926 [Amanita muscaria Koide BX008]